MDEFEKFSSFLPLSASKLIFLLLASKTKRKICQKFVIFIEKVSKLKKRENNLEEKRDINWLEIGKHCHIKKWYVKQKHASYKLFVAFSWCHTILQVGKVKGKKPLASLPRSNDICHDNKCKISFPRNCYHRHSVRQQNEK